MKLGRQGEEWINSLNALYTDSASLCTTWQQEFFESFSGKAENFGVETNISVKQLDQLNKIADIYGLHPLALRELDD